jgi:hypothetical protein
LGQGATNEDFVVFVGKPAALRSEGDKVIPMTSEGQDRDEACAARGHEEDVFQVELMTRAEAQVDITNPNGAGRRPVEALNGMGVNGTQCFKVRAFWRDVAGGSQV